MPLPVGNMIVGQKTIKDKNYYVVKKRNGGTYLEEKKNKPMKKKLKLVRKR